MSHTILQVEHLKKTFTTKKWFKDPVSFTAVNDVSFDLKKGEILGLLGPNGAGKTTIIQMLLDLLTPSSGTISYFGKNIADHRHEILEQVSFASTYLKLPGSLTVAENLDVYGKLYGMPKDFRKQQIKKNMEIFEIEKLQNNLAKTLSAGQLTRLMLAKAFLPNPKIVLLDEPSAALDPDIALQMRTFILKQRETLGTSIIFTSHNMAEVEELCDRILVLKNGTIIANETPKNLAATVTTSRLELLVENIVSAEQFARAKNLTYTITGSYITFYTEEQQLPVLLTTLMQEQIKYSAIAIEKPTLEDYFLKLSERTS
jgi:ABC-2 type transport system ATP-binding protein